LHQETPCAGSGFSSHRPYVAACCKKGKGGVGFLCGIILGVLTYFFYGTGVIEIFFTNTPLPFSCILFTLHINWQELAT
jgi:hypothetical protein